MTDPDFAPLDIRYRMTRGDYVALCRAMTSNSPRRIVIALLVLIVAIGVGGLVGVGGDVSRFGEPLIELVIGRAPLPFYLFLIAAVAFLVLGRPWIVALQGAAIYRRNAVADKYLHYRFSEAGCDIDTPGMAWHFDWPAITRVIETKSHLFLALSGREAMALPRRAFPSEADYDRLKSFAAAQIGRARPKA